MGRIAGRFVRVEPRRRARAFVLGLLSDLPRKNCWTLAEYAGDTTPYGLQHLLSRARWDADAVRDDIRSFVVERLHHQEAVLVVDETGDLKKGTLTVGVQRQYSDWALTDIADDRPGHHQLLVRRNRRTRELGFYRCYSATQVPLSTLVRVAGRRWTVEETFQSGKGLAGLDEDQVRRWTSWHRWVTLAMLAHAFLTVVRADEQARDPTPDGLIPLTCNEIQHLFTALIVQPAPEAAYRLRWSHWRRRHQARSQTSHYQRQAAQT
ncbi:hypothetical protein C3492_43090 [Streptomyces sp. Ru62]|uniref:transposase n=1 Tax=Streptomyces sp. Ru62 TaxID=2080745 RepID=UPI000CDD51B4|nr:transposase [Streptomyces sp. Ru62]POX57519.1 hypothetical protein C3492_43090 [Streptomyces sp. Ru62]